MGASLPRAASGGLTCGVSIRKNAAQGTGYTQLILRLVEDMRIGESFFMPLAEGYRFGKWEKPQDMLCLMGEIKLKPEYWGTRIGNGGHATGGGVVVRPDGRLVVGLPTSQEESRSATGVGEGGIRSA